MSMTESATGLRGLQNDKLEKSEEIDTSTEKEKVLNADSSTNTEASTVLSEASDRDNEGPGISRQTTELASVDPPTDDHSKSSTSKRRVLPAQRIRKLFPSFHIKKESRACDSQRLSRRHTAPANPSSTRKLRPAGCLKQTGSKSHDFVSSTKHHVSFDKIQIREHNVTVGDNPSVFSGPPVTLDWEVQHETEAKVDEYEKERGERRTKSEMRMPATVREDMLIDEWEISYRRVREASMQAREGFKQRMDACKYQFADGARLMLEQTAKACKKPLTRRTESEKEIKIWTKAHQIDHSIPKP